MKEWKLKKDTKLNDYKVFSTRKKETVSPKDGAIHDFYVIDAPNWVQIIAVTEENNIVLVKQFRHGTGEFSLEIPGGMIDPGESPLECARRELLEETGFTSSEWKRVGKIRPNPAIMSNSCSVFLAVNCEKTSEPCPDGTEEIETLLVSPEEIKLHIKEGVINHSIVIAAFGLYLLSE